VDTTFFTINVFGIKTFVGVEPRNKVQGKRKVYKIAFELLGPRKKDFGDDIEDVIRTKLLGAPQHEANDPYFFYILSNRSVEDFLFKLVVQRKIELDFLMGIVKTPKYMKRIIDSLEEKDD